MRSRARAEFNGTKALVYWAVQRADVALIDV
jgi:hypothetical protein